MNSHINAQVLQEIIGATTQSQIFMYVVFLGFKILLRIHLPCHCLAWARKCSQKHFHSKCQFCEFSVSPESPNYRCCIQLKLQNQRWAILSAAVVMSWDGILGNMSHLLMRMGLQQPSSQRCKNNRDCHLMEITYVTTVTWWKSQGHGNPIANSFPPLFHFLSLSKLRLAYLMWGTSSALSVCSRKCSCVLGAPKQRPLGDTHVNQHRTCPLMMPEHHSPKPHFLLILAFSKDSSKLLRIQ